MRLEQIVAGAGPRAPAVRALLAALAWGRCPGLPREGIWLPVARALAAGSDSSLDTVSEEDAAWLLRRAGDLILAGEAADGGAVFRLRGAALGAAVRGEPTDGSGTAAAAWHRQRASSEQHITEALLATVPASGTGRDWLAAHAYVRAHLAQHAAAAGGARLPDLLRDPGFAAVADPVGLSPLLVYPERELRDVGRAYWRARELLGADPRANAAYLAEATRAIGGPPAVTSPRSIRPLYRTHLAAGPRDDSLLVIAFHAGAINSVALATAPEGELLLASTGGTGDPVVRVWDPLAGTAVRELTLNSQSASAVAFAHCPGGRLMLATGGSQPDTSVRLWDPLTGEPIGDPLTGHSGTGLELGAGNREGRLLLASGNEDATVRLWDPTINASAHKNRRSHARWVDCVAFGTVEAGGEAGVGRLLVASASQDQGVQVWDALAGEPVGEPLDTQNGAVLAVALGTTASGDLLLATADESRALHIWDPLTGMPHGGPLDGHTGRVRSLAFTPTVKGGGGAAAGLRRGRRDRVALGPLTGRPALPRLASHTGLIEQVTFGTVGGHGEASDRLLLATACGDHTARLWDPRTGVAAGEPLTGHTGWVRAVAFGGGPAGQSLLVSGGGDKTLRVWDPATHTYLAILRRRSAIRSLAMAGPLVAIGDDYGLSVIELSF